MMAEGGAADDGMLSMGSVEGRLGELESMGDGWMDGEGVPPTRWAVMAARAVLARMEGRVPAPLITPVVDGGMEIEWDESLVEAAVGGDGSITCYDLSRKGDEPGAGTGTFRDPSAAADWLLERFRNV